MESNVFFEMLKKNSIEAETKTIQPNKQLPFTEIQAQCLCEWIKYLNKNNIDKMSKKLLRDIQNATYQSRGLILEALAYYYLMHFNIPFDPQYHVSGTACYKNGEDGYDADGVIQISRTPPETMVFEIKSFNLGEQMNQLFKTKLQEEFNKLRGKNGIPDKNFFFMIGGSLDKSNLSYQKDLFPIIHKILACLSQECLCPSKSQLQYRLTYKDLEITAIEEGNCSPILGTSYSASDIFEWASNNEFRFLKHGSQICYTKPFMIICPFEKASAQDNLAEKYRTQIALRTLCRRIFIRLPKVHDRWLSEFDSHAMQGISVAMAARKITAIMFIEVSCNDPNKCDAWAFINPNGDNKLLNYQISTLFKSFNAVIDKFEYDNY